MTGGKIHIVQGVATLLKFVRHAASRTHGLEAPFTATGALRRADCPSTPQGLSPGCFRMVSAVRQAPLQHPLEFYRIRAVCVAEVPDPAGRGFFRIAMQGVFRLDCSLMDTLLLLTLLGLPGIKPQEIERFAAHCNGTGGVVETIAAEFEAEGRRLPARRDIATAYRQSLQSLELAARSGIIVIHRWQQRYPARLAKIPAAPPLLFVKGDLAGLSGPRAITIVGTRSPTAYGCARCAAVSERFTAHGFVVVSGLALGCDTIAHRACLRAGGRTAAVLAHGLVQVYPAANRRLAGAILDRGGCLVSEHPPEVKPQAAYFVRRNRIQAALGDGVVVIESGRRGGTMHTAAACRQQGKPLFCLQHPEKYRHHLQVRGNHQLLAAAGARPLNGPGAVESAVEQLVGRSG